MPGENVGEKVLAKQVMLIQFWDKGAVFAVALDREFLGDTFKAEGLGDTECFCIHRVFSVVNN